MPSTSIASISSRILRAPRSAQIAEPPAPAMISAVTIGPASRTTASTRAAPVNDCAPSWRTSEPSCSAITAPNGIETSAAGRIDHAGDEPGLLDQLAQLERRGAAAERATSSAEGEEVAGSLQCPWPTGCSYRHLLRNEPAGGVHAVGSAPLRPARARRGRGCPSDGAQLQLGSAAAAAVRAGGRLGLRSAASFSSAMPIGPIRCALRNWRTTGSVLDSSISRGPNMARWPW